MSRRVYSDEEKAEALRIYESDGPSAVLRDLGIPKGTVSRWAKAAGIGTVRNEKMAEAREAADNDSATLRAIAANQSIRVTNTIAEAIERRLAIEAETVDLKELATVYGIFADKHKLFVGMDQGNEEHTAVDAWLNHVMG
ncbi:MAG: hypothetical protein L0J03_16030 [Brevibacterium sp.]|nr:hypothetical protein [Brevibacterium sp.]